MTSPSCSRGAGTASFSHDRGLGHVTNAPDLSRHRRCRADLARRRPLGGVRAPDTIHSSCRLSVVSSDYRPAPAPSHPCGPEPLLVVACQDQAVDTAQSCTAADHRTGMPRWSDLTAGTPEPPGPDIEFVGASALDAPTRIRAGLRAPGSSRRHGLPVDRGYLRALGRPGTERRSRTLSSSGPTHEQRAVEDVDDEAAGANLVAGPPSRTQGRSHVLGSAGRSRHTTVRSADARRSPPVPTASSWDPWKKNGTANGVERGRAGSWVNDEDAPAKVEERKGLCAVTEADSTVPRRRSKY